MTSRGMGIVRELLLLVRVVTSQSAQPHTSRNGVLCHIVGSDMHLTSILEPPQARSVDIRNRLTLCRYVSRGLAELRLLRMTVLSFFIKVCSFPLHAAGCLCCVKGHLSNSTKCASVRINLSDADNDAVAHQNAYEICSGSRVFSFR